MVFKSDLSWNICPLKPIENLHCSSFGSFPLFFSTLCETLGHIDLSHPFSMFWERRRKFGWGPWRRSEGLGSSALFVAALSRSVWRNSLVFQAWADFAPSWHWDRSDWWMLGGWSWRYVISPGISRSSSASTKSQQNWACPMFLAFHCQAGGQCQICLRCLLHTSAARDEK